jgi:type II secretion system protein G
MEELPEHSDQTRGSSMARFFLIPCRTPRCSLLRAFTLIELLVVVAIIAILAAIAVPNLLEAQIRAKVSRVKADERSVATAMEAYRVDSQNYPAENYPSPEQVSAYNGQFLPNSVKLRPITTPVAYMTSLPVDAFDPGTDPLNLVGPHTFHYASINDPLDPDATPFYMGANEAHVSFSWIIQSYGPDRGSDVGNTSYWQFPDYDPSNGTVSVGNILRWGP